MQTTYATPDNVLLNEHIKRSKVFYPNNYKNSIGTRSSTYPAGTVKINDWYGEWEGWQKGDEVRGEYSSIKTATLKLFATAFPKTAKAFEVISFIGKVSDDVDLIDPTKDTIITANYAVREFRHELFVWDYNDEWYDAGYSKSKLFYKAATTHFIREDNGQPDTATNQDYTHIDEVDAAKHFEDYDWLSDTAYEQWEIGGRYVETY